MSGIALLLPPGWTLHPGGPHIALPLLKGFLQHHDIETRLYDLNIGSTKYHHINIDEQEVISACKQLTRGAMNEVYFNAEDQLQSLAKKYDGVWYAHEGYRRNNCDIASPEDIRHYSRCPSPFTDYFTQQAIPDILRQDPRVIGISLTVPTQVLQVFELVRLLRKAGYDGCIVLGGNIIWHTAGRIILLATMFAE